MSLKKKNLQTEITNFTSNFNPPCKIAPGVLLLIYKLKGKIVERAGPRISLLNRGTGKLITYKEYLQVLPCFDSTAHVSMKAHEYTYPLAIEGTSAPMNIVRRRLLILKINRILSYFSAFVRRFLLVLKKFLIMLFFFGLCPALFLNILISIHAQEFRSFYLVIHFLYCLKNAIPLWSAYAQTETFSKEVTFFVILKTYLPSCSIILYFIDWDFFLKSTYLQGLLGWLYGSELYCADSDQPKSGTKQPSNIQSSINIQRPIEPPTDYSHNEILAFSTASGLITWYGLRALALHRPMPIPGYLLGNLDPVVFDVGSRLATAAAAGGVFGLQVDRGESGKRMFFDAPVHLYRDFTSLETDRLSHQRIEAFAANRLALRGNSANSSETTLRLAGRDTYTVDDITFAGDYVSLINAETRQVVRRFLPENHKKYLMVVGDDDVSSPIMDGLRFQSIELIPAYLKIMVGGTLFICPSKEVADSVYYHFSSEDKAKLVIIHSLREKPVGWKYGPNDEVALSITQDCIITGAQLHSLGSADAFSSTLNLDHPGTPKVNAARLFLDKKRMEKSQTQIDTFVPSWFYE